MSIQLRRDVVSIIYTELQGVRYWGHSNVWGYNQDFLQVSIISLVDILSSGVSVKWGSTVFLHNVSRPTHVLHSLAHNYYNSHKKWEKFLVSMTNILIIITHLAGSKVVWKGILWLAGQTLVWKWQTSVHSVSLYITWLYRVNCQRELLFGILIMPWAERIMDHFLTILCMRSWHNNDLYRY